MNPFLDQVWKEYENKKDRSNQHEGSKKAQVAQSGSIQRHQTGEGAHRGDVSYQQRGHHLLQHLADCSAVIGMGNEMQRVVDGYSDDDRTYSQHNQRDVAPHDRDKAHGKKPPETNRRNNEQQAPLSPEREHQQQQNQRHGDRDGQPTVFLNLTGIAHGYHRRSCDGNFHAGHRLHGLLCDAVDIIHQQVVVRRLHRTIWRRQHGNGIFLSWREDIPIVHFKRHGRLPGLQTVSYIKKTEGVVADARSEKARGRHHHHLHIGSQLIIGKIRSCQHVLHAHIVTVREHERHVLVEE